MQRIRFFLVISILLSPCGIPYVSGMDIYLNEIPNSAVFVCKTCHTAGLSAKTLFGEDFKSNGFKWNAGLANKDSDRDGYSNGVELQDPSGTWVPGLTNLDIPSLVSNPGDQNSIPKSLPSQAR